MFSIARTNFAARLSCVALSRSISVILLSVVSAAHGFAQESPTSHTGLITPLSELLAEAEKNNPRIEAARQGWQAAKQVPTQVSTLPDPQFNLQHVSVGSRRPLPLGHGNTAGHPPGAATKNEVASRNRHASPAGRKARSPAQTTPQPFTGITGHRAGRSPRNTSCAIVRRSSGRGASTES